MASRGAVADEVRPLAPDADSARSCAGCGEGYRVDRHGGVEVDVCP